MADAVSRDMRLALGDVLMGRDSRESRKFDAPDGALLVAMQWCAGHGVAVTVENARAAWRAGLVSGSACSGSAGQW